jgi:phosphoglycolate phosphatase
LSLSAAATLVLFDIDGTLVDVRGAGRRAFSRALALTWGIDDDLAHVTFAGATDLGVLSQLAARHAIDVRAHGTFFAHMARTRDEELVREPPIALPHARDSLEVLAARDDVVLGLLTGNARACAHLKLQRAQLPARFAHGGYGDEHADRNELARRARAGHERVVVVGDTMKDVEAARAIGARAIAVCTGRYGRDELAGADVVVDTLAALDWELVLRSTDSRG